MTARVVKGRMNGIVFCRLCFEICLTEHNDPEAEKGYETASYMLPDDCVNMSDDKTKKLFNDLFGKNLELTINDLERVTDICILKNEKVEVHKP